MRCRPVSPQPGRRPERARPRPRRRARPPTGRCRSFGRFSTRISRNWSRLLSRYSNPWSRMQFGCGRRPDRRRTDPERPSLSARPFRLPSSPLPGLTSRIQPLGLARSSWTQPRSTTLKRNLKSSTACCLARPATGPRPRSFQRPSHWLTSRPRSAEHRKSSATTTSPMRNLPKPQAPSWAPSFSQGSQASCTEQPVLKRCCPQGHQQSRGQPGRSV